jgi:hypothetical protein
MGIRKSNLLDDVTIEIVVRENRFGDMLGLVN